MDNIILFLVFVLIVLIGFFIYKIYIKSENFSTTETTLSSSGIQLVKNTLAVIPPDTFRKYFTNYSTTESTNIYKKGLDYYLTLFTDQKKTSSPFRDLNPEPDNIIPINDIILEIIRTGKLNNYSDELRNIIICTYLSDPNVSKYAPENVSIKNFADSNKICPTEILLPPKNTSWPLYLSSFFTLLGAVSLGFYIYGLQSQLYSDASNMTRLGSLEPEAYKSQLYLDASNTGRGRPGVNDESLDTFKTFTGKDFAGVQNARVDVTPKVSFNPKLIETNNLTNFPLKYSNLNKSEALRTMTYADLSKRTNANANAYFDSKKKTSLLGVDSSSDKANTIMHVF